MWQRQAGRTNCPNTSDSPWYDTVKGHGNRDADVRDMTQHSGRHENNKDFNKAVVHQNMSYADTRLMVTCRSTSSQSSSVFSRDSHKKNITPTSYAGHLTSRGARTPSKHTLTEFSGLQSNLPTQNVWPSNMQQESVGPPKWPPNNMEPHNASHQSMGKPFVIQSIGPPNMNHQNMGPPNMNQQNIGPPNLRQQNMGPISMTHQNMGPPNRTKHNMALPNMSQPNNLAPFQNGPPITASLPPGFSNMNMPPPGYDDNRIPSNMPPPPIPGPFIGLPPPNNRFMSRNVHPPISLENCQPNIPVHQGINHMTMFSINQMNNQQGLPVGEDNMSSQNEESITRTLDQKWVNQFIQERQIKPTKVEKEKSKVGKAKEMLQKWFQTLKKVEAQHDKLTECIKSGDSEWQRELQKANFLKEEIDQVEAEFSSQFDMDSLSKDIKKKQRKREWQKRQKKALAFRKKEIEAKTYELHLQIDQWRAKEIAKDQAKFKDASVKREAGGVLGDVRRKQGDASRAISLLQAIKKLRNFRKQEAELKGVYQKPTYEQTRDFDQRLQFLEKLMEKHHKLYESEEKALVVMIAEEEEVKERERREKRVTKQLAEAAASDSSDPMKEFYRYYTQAENGLDSLLHIRHGWDMYVVPETVAGGSCIPQGDVSPVSPKSKIWAAFVHSDNEKSS